MRKTFLLALAVSLMALGVVGAPGALANDPGCNGLGLERGVYPPSDPVPANKGIYDITFSPTTANAVAGIVLPSGAVLCGTEVDGPASQQRYYRTGTITTAPGVQVHCANDKLDPASATGRYCRNQSWGTCAVTARGGADAPVARRECPENGTGSLPDDAYVGQGKTDAYCTALVICAAIGRQQDNEPFDTRVHYNAEGCDGTAVACYTARAKLWGVTCKSDVIQRVNSKTPQGYKFDLTIEPMSCGGGVGDRVYIDTIDEFTLCAYAGVNIGNNCGSGGDPTTWVQKNGPAGDWSYALVAQLVDGNDNPKETVSGVASGTWTP